jgi:uncharacterized protein (UPF0333 family)
MRNAGQGATEYLVLLAVVLIVALVSVALLGFFPGMASDAQATQSRTYWASAQPISIVELGALTDSASYSCPYLRVRNTGAYPLRITKLIGPVNYAPAVEGPSGDLNISDYYYLAPGEEKYFGVSGSQWFNLPDSRGIYFYTTSSCVSTTRMLCGASSLCVPNSAQAGTLSMGTFGFEYIEYIDGQQVTKRQIGAKPLVIKCKQP